MGGNGGVKAGNPDAALLLAVASSSCNLDTCWCRADANSNQRRLQGPTRSQHTANISSVVAHACLRRVSGSMNLVPADMPAEQQGSHMVVGIARSRGLAHLKSQRVCSAALVRQKLMSHVLPCYVLLLLQGYPNRAHKANLCQPGPT